MDFITTTLSLILSPLVLIPCGFVGASKLSAAKVSGLGAIVGLFGGVFSYPLFHLFIAMNPPGLRGDDSVLIVGIAGAVAGALVSLSMYIISRRDRDSAISADESK